MNPFAAPAPAFDEPIEMLAACHERIEAQLCTLEKLIPHVSAKGADTAAREAATQVMRYFDTAGANHHRDEDEDVFPLLRRLAADRDRPEVSAVINNSFFPSRCPVLPNGSRPIRTKCFRAHRRSTGSCISAPGRALPVGLSGEDLRSSRPTDID